MEDEKRPEAQMIKKAVFPAAGLGTRFLPATKASPKEMLPLVDKPLIQYAVEEAGNCGMEELLIITGKQKRAIEDHFDSAYELEDALTKKGKKDLLEMVRRLNHINFAYIRQRAPLGLGHAILCAKPFVKVEPFAVLLSDDVIDPEDSLLADMVGIATERDAPVVALEMVAEDDVEKYGIIEGKDEGGGIYRIKRLVEKPKPSEAPSRLGIIGRYILTPDIFDILETLPAGKGGEVQLTDALNRLAGRRPVYGYLFRGKRYDAGDKLGFLQATVELALKDKALGAAFREFLAGLMKDEFSSPHPRR
ncbi:MAG: UTP--glucose-1-phosphate uridylyltransferase GalU [Nitrospiraceae bacterium]|nr:UTP--glucose-1-phosphate uridylyltransferase GalU [Nitrospiraceae bacterium]